MSFIVCNRLFSRSIGYNEVAKTTRAFHSAGHHNFIRDSDDQRELLARPDFSQMIPFKPKINVLPGDHVVPGGTFPMPPAAVHLCSIIPPATKFIGPFVHVEYLMEVFNRIQLPDKG